MTKERFGTTTNLYHNQAYNNRLQLVENRLGTDANSATTWNRGALINYYSNQARSANNQWLNATDNNGNVTRVQHFVPTADVPDPINNYAVPMIDDYDYDGLNRITLVTGKQQASSGSGWTSVYAQGYSYDRWGNRTINQAATYGTNINNTLYTVDAATNRFTQLSYDLAGSVTSDAGNTREYDGENRMKKAWGGSQWNYYVYDADGKRVRRIVGSVEYWQVYGLEGELIAEYPVNGTASIPQKEYGYRNGQMLIVGGCDLARWIVADHLGTPRMEVDPSGSLTVMRRHDYLPFGEELTVGMGNSSIRTAGMGYQADCVRQRFTGYERDGETGLDYAQARYYANLQGRFTSVDPSQKSVVLLDPRSWNRYTYVLNNPFVYVDRNGKWPTGIHNQIIDKAFPGLSKEQRESLKKVSAGQDGPVGQTMAHVHDHAMRAPGEKKESAKRSIEDFVRTNMEAAQKEQGGKWPEHITQVTDKSLNEFGKALHAVTDRTSPTHTDEKGDPMTWPGIPAGAIEAAQATAHAVGERKINDAQMEKAVNAARDLFKWTYGEDAYKEAIKEPERQDVVAPKKPNEKKLQ